MLFLKLSALISMMFVMACQTIVIEPEIPLPMLKSLPHHYVPQYQGTVQVKKRCQLSNQSPHHIRVHWLSIHPYRLHSPIGEDIIMHMEELLRTQGIDNEAFPFWVLSGHPEKGLFMSFTALNEVKRYGLDKLPMQRRFDSISFSSANICKEDPSYIALKNCLADQQTFLFICASCYDNSRDGMKLDGRLELDPQQTADVTCSVPMGPDDMPLDQLARQQQAVQPGMDTVVLWIIENLDTKSLSVELDTWRNMSKRQWSWKFHGME